MRLFSSIGKEKDKKKMQYQRAKKSLTCTIPPMTDHWDAIKDICAKAKPKNLLECFRYIMRNFIRDGFLPQILAAHVDEFTLEQIREILDLVFTSNHDKKIDTPKFVVAVTREEKNSGFPAPEEQKSIQVRPHVRKTVVPLIDWKRFLPHVCEDTILNPFQILRSLLNSLKTMGMMPHLEDIDLNKDINLTDACLLLSEFFNVPHQQFVSLNPDHRAERDYKLLPKKVNPETKALDPTLVREYKRIIANFPNTIHTTEPPILTPTDISRILANYPMYGTGTSLITAAKWRDNPTKTYNSNSKACQVTGTVGQKRSIQTMESSRTTSQAGQKRPKQELTEKQIQPVQGGTPKGVQQAETKQKQSESPALSPLKEILLYSSLFEIQDRKRTNPPSDFVLTKFESAKNPNQILLFGYTFVPIKPLADVDLKVSCPITGKYVILGGKLNEQPQSSEKVIGIDLTNQNWKDILSCKF